jgi:membrane-associated phospholipid phosphatase
VVSLPAGSGLLLLAGSGTVSYSGGSVVDITVGQTVASGTALTARHRVLAAENTTAAVTITSDTAVLGVEGFYTVSSGAGLDYNALADALKQMGLFQGTGTAYGSGYDLEQAPTRIVGLVMFLRLIGEEGAALSSTAANPFADTPAWCDRYVAYAYEKGYTKGNNVSAGGQRYFGPDAQLSAGEYMTFLLRALGYSDSGASPDFSWANAVGKSVEFGVLNAAEQAKLTGSPFLRAQVAYLSYFALSAPLKDGSGILLYMGAHHLVKRGMSGPSITLWTVLLGGLSLGICALALYRSRSGGRKKLEFVCLWGTVYLLAGLAAINIIKAVWQRTRFDDMLTAAGGGFEGAFAQFTSWMQPFGNGGSSFPSGHTAAACSVFNLTLACDVCLKWNRRRTLVWALCWAYVAFMALCRLVIGRHYLSDTLAAAFVMLLLYLGMRKTKWYRAGARELTAPGT